jgi:hypothetical protein
MCPPFLWTARCSPVADMCLHASLRRCRPGIVPPTVLAIVPGAIRREMQRSRHYRQGAGGSWPWDRPPLGMRVLAPINVILGKIRPFSGVGQATTVVTSYKMLGGH